MVKQRTPTTTHRTCTKYLASALPLFFVHTSLGTRIIPNGYQQAAALYLLSIFVSTHFRFHRSAPRKLRLVDQALPMHSPIAPHPEM